LQRQQFRSGSGKATTAVRKSEEKRGKRQAARRAEEPATATAKQQHRFTVKTFLQLAASAASLHMKLQMYAGGGEKKGWVVRTVPVHRSSFTGGWVISIETAGGRKWAAGVQGLITRRASTITATRTLWFSAGDVGKCAKAFTKLLSKD